MALHFDIKINGGTIGSVYIRRTQKMRSSWDSYRYEFDVTLNGKVTRGEVSHVYADGALILIDKVLARAEAVRQIATDIDRTETPM